MRPLLRYIWLKTTRENSITPILLAPLAMVIAPVVGLLGRALVTGRPLHPFLLAGETPARSLEILSHVALAMSSLAGGVAAFWIFRQEIADRSIAAMVMAKRPLAISFVGVLYGLAVATLAFTMSMAALSLLTLAIPEDLGLLFVRLIGISVVAAAVALMCCTLSPDPGLLLPVAIVTFVTFANSFGETSSTTLMVGAGMILALPLIASFLLERRCAR